MRLLLASVPFAAAYTATGLLPIVCNPPVARGSVVAHHVEGIPHGDTSPNQELPSMYRARWAGEAGTTSDIQPTARRSPAPLGGAWAGEWGGCQVVTATGDVALKMRESQEEPPMACVSTLEKTVCGPLSFDSVDGGLVCVEESESGKWVCA